MGRCWPSRHPSSLVETVGQKVLLRKVGVSGFFIASSAELQPIPTKCDIQCRTYWCPNADGDRNPDPNHTLPSLFSYPNNAADIRPISTLDDPATGPPRGAFEMGFGSMLLYMRSMIPGNKAHGMLCRCACPLIYLEIIYLAIGRFTKKDVHDARASTSLGRSFFPMHFCAEASSVYYYLASGRSSVSGRNGSTI